MTPEANLRLRVRAMKREVLSVSRRAAAMVKSLLAINAQISNSKFAAQPIHAQAALVRRGLAKVEQIEKFTLPEVRRIITEVEGLRVESETPPVGIPLSDLPGNLESLTRAAKALLNDWLKSHAPAPQQPPPPPGSEPTR